MDITHPIVQGAITGALAAAAIDVAAFRAWKQWRDLVTYDWGVASFRWVQGAVVGALSAAGLSAILGL